MFCTDTHLWFCRSRSDSPRSRVWAAAGSWSLSERWSGTETKQPEETSRMTAYKHRCANMNSDLCQYLELTSHMIQQLWTQSHVENLSLQSVRLLLVLLTTKNPIFNKQTKTKQGFKLSHSSNAYIGAMSFNFMSEMYSLLFVDLCIYNRKPQRHPSKCMFLWGQSLHIAYICVMHFVDSIFSWW